MVGQHIRVLKDGRWVHAVDCGDETVLHLAEEAPPPRVRRAYRPEFVSGAAAVEVVTHRERTFPPKEIVKRAYSRASDPALASMFRDSEAFVEWCATGRLSGPHNVVVDLAGAAEPASAKPAAPKPAKAGPARKPPPAKRIQAKARVRVAPKAKAKPKARPARRAKAAGKKPARAKAGAKARKAPARRGKPARKSRR